MSGSLITPTSSIDRSDSSIDPFNSIKLPINAAKLWKSAAAKVRIANSFKVKEAAMALQVHVETQIIISSLFSYGLVEYEIL